MRNAERKGRRVRPTRAVPYRIRMSHLLALALLALDCLVRAWRIQLAAWTAGGRLAFTDAFHLTLYGEAASQLTPNRLGGEPARFLGLTEAGLRPVTGIVAIGVEVAAEWPGFLLAAGAPFLPALAWGGKGHPPFAQMFYGALALIHAPLVVPLPSGGGGVEVAFLNGFAGDFGARQLTMLLLWRFYTAALLTIVGVYAMVRRLGYHVAVELFKIGWGKTRRTG